MGINKQFNIREIKFQGKVRKEAAADARLTELFWIHYPLDIKGSHHMAAFQGGLDEARAEIWSLVILARNQINGEILRLKDLAYSVQKIDEIFSETKAQVKLRLEAFKKQHTENEFIQLVNELENRMESFSGKPIAWWTLDKEAFDPEQLQKIPKSIEEGWDSIKKLL